MTEATWLYLLTLTAVALLCAVIWIGSRLIGLEKRRQRAEAIIAASLSRVGSEEHARRERKDGLKLSESSLETGTRVLELAHRALSDTTFTLIEKFARDTDFKLGSREAKEGHDRRTEAFYEGVRKTNRVAHVAADLLINRRTLFQRRSRPVDASRLPDTKKLASGSNDDANTSR